MSSENTTGQAQGAGKTFFESLYELGKDAIKSLSKPIMRRQVKRLLESAHDDLSNQIDTATNTVNDELVKLNKMNVTTIVTAELTIRDAKDSQVIIEAKYEQLFGTPYVKSDEDSE